MRASIPRGGRDAWPTEAAATKTGNSAEHVPDAGKRGAGGKWGRSNGREEA